MKFNAAGRILRVIPQPPEFLSLQVPHGLTLLEHLDLVCIADRENMRVVCPRYVLTHFILDFEKENCSKIAHGFNVAIKIPELA